MSHSAETPSNSTPAPTSNDKVTLDQTSPPAPPGSSSPPDSAPPPTSKPSTSAPPPTPSAPPPSSSPPPSSPPPSSPPPSPPPAVIPLSPPPSPKSSPPPAQTDPPPPPSTPSPSTPPESGNSSPPPTSSSPPPPATPTPQSPPATQAPPPSTPQFSPPPLVSDTPPSPLQASPPKQYPVGGAFVPPPPKSSIKSASANPDDSPDTSSENGNQNTVIGAAVAGVIIVGMLAMVFFVIKRKKKKESRGYINQQYMLPPTYAMQSDRYYYGQQQPPIFSGQSDSMSMYNSQHMANSFGSQRGPPMTPDSGLLGSSQTHFTYEMLMEITGGFARQNIIGEGGFGCVYKGTTRDGKVVAVKQLKAGSGQGDREFRAEVDIISRVHHRHLVSLVGYCISDQQKLLIYEFVPNSTLEHHLHAKGQQVLDWHKRLRIAIGSAKGLAYLHEDCHPKIIHRDIKSANILLDDEFEAQVADFGLARLNDTTQTHVSTRVMGTFGYLAPEYASSGKLSDRSDVFSFGVVLLELITGRKPVDPDQPLGEESLVEWARPLLIHAIETGDIRELVDPRLGSLYVEAEVFRMIETAAACVRHSGPKRPRMVQVMRALDSEGEMSDISNGVKVGQSTAYNSGQYNQEIMKFRRMALGSDDSSDYGYSGEQRSVRGSMRSLETSGEYTSGNESESRAINSQRYR